MLKPSNKSQKTTPKALLVTAAVTMLGAPQAEAMERAAGASSSSSSLATFHAFHIRNATVIDPDSRDLDGTAMAPGTTEGAADATAGSDAAVTSPFSHGGASSSSSKVRSHGRYGGAPDTPSLSSATLLKQFQSFTSTIAEGGEDDAAEAEGPAIGAAASVAAPLNDPVITMGGAPPFTVPRVLLESLVAAPPAPVAASSASSSSVPAEVLERCLWSIPGTAGRNFTGLAWDPTREKIVATEGPTDLHDPATGARIRTGGHTVVRFGLAGYGDAELLAGRPGQQGLDAEGLPAAASRLNAPTGVVVDAHGVIYVADTGNNRICRIGLDRTLTTVAGVRVPEAAYALLHAGVALLRGQHEAVRPYAATLADQTEPPAPRPGVRPPSTVLLRAFLDAVEECQGDLARALDDLLHVRAKGHLEANRDDPQQALAKSNHGTPMVRPLFNGDNHASATDAELNRPTCMALGAGGKLYFIDSENRCIRVLEPRPAPHQDPFTLRTIAGNGAHRQGVAGPVRPATRVAISPLQLAVLQDGSIEFTTDLGLHLQRLTRYETKAGVEQWEYEEAVSDGGIAGPVGIVRGEDDVRHIVRHLGEVCEAHQGEDGRLESRPLTGSSADDAGNPARNGVRAITEPVHPTGVLAALPGDLILVATRNAGLRLIGPEHGDASLAERVNRAKALHPTTHLNPEHHAEFDRIVASLRQWKDNPQQRWKAAVRKGWRLLDNPDGDDGPMCSVVRSMYYNRTLAWRAQLALGTIEETTGPLASYAARVEARQAQHRREQQASREASKRPRHEEDAGVSPATPAPVARTKNSPS